MPVDEVVEMATRWVTERGYAFHDQMGLHLAEQFYMGVNRKRAGRMLQARLGPAVGAALHQERLDKLAVYDEMADQLVAEGWEYRPDPTGIDAGLWLHLPTYTSVNRMGGFWRSWEEATEVTFHSETRKALKGQE
jgi:hypothetical protein